MLAIELWGAIARDWEKPLVTDFRHDWVFNVLEDLQSYALRNGLPRLADAADHTLTVARAELAQAARLAAEKPRQDD